MFYIDTSVWVSAITEEPKSGNVWLWFEKFAAEKFAISDWVVTEFSSALSVKIRTGQITMEQRASALREFSATVNDSLQILPIRSGHFQSAALFADNHLTGLRAADALHVAVAADYGAIICSLDSTMTKAASLLGLEAVVP